MRRIAATLFLSCTAPAAFAQVITADDVIFSRGPDPWGSTMHAGLTGVSDPEAMVQLSRTGWAFRIEGDVPDKHETVLPAPNTETYGGANSTMEWIDLSERGLMAAVERAFVSDSDGPDGPMAGGEVEMSLEVTNIRKKPLTLSLFHILDPDLGGSASNDNAQLLSQPKAPVIRFSDPDGTVLDYAGIGADGYLVRPKGNGDVVSLLANDIEDTADNSGLPAVSIDATAMVAWQHRTIAPMEKLTVKVRFSVNKALMTDLAMTSLAASPSPAVRNAELEYSATVANTTLDRASPASMLTFDLKAAGVKILGTEGCDNDNDPSGYPICQLGAIKPGESREVSLRVLPSDETESPMQMTVTASSAVADDIVPQDNSATLATPVVDPAADLGVTKTNNSNGVAFVTDGWTWTLRLGNAKSATAPATFATGELLLLDQLPSGPGQPFDPAMYGPVTVVMNPDTSGVISCDIPAWMDLTCYAMTPVSIAPGASIAVSVQVHPVEIGLYSNPRTDGVCIVDPMNTVAESSETNNNCADSVDAIDEPVIDYVLFKDGFED